MVSPLLFGTPCRKGLEQSNATVRGTVAAEGSTEANLYFLSLLRKKMQTSPFRNLSMTNQLPIQSATIPQSKIKDF